MQGAVELPMTWPATTGPTPTRSSSSGATRLEQLLLELGRLPLAGQRPTSGGPQGHDRGGLLGAEAARDAQGGARAQQLAEGRATQPLAQGLGRACHQSVQRKDRAGAEVHGLGTGGQQYANGFTLPTSARVADAFAGEDLASGPQGVDLVALGSGPSGGPLRPVDLDDPLAPVEQGRGKAGAEAAGALDRPEAAVMSLSESDEPAVSLRVRRHGDVVEHRTVGADGGGGVAVLVRVDADDDIDSLRSSCATWPT